MTTKWQPTNRLILLWNFLSSVVRRFIPISSFESRKYWQKRYLRGGASGPGSAAHLAEFKAEFLNSFVKVNGIGSVIEFGCGDGRQLLLSKYPKYLGLDVSGAAIDRCRALFAGDSTKNFLILEQYRGEKASLVISLDVIFHLVEDDVFHEYMSTLFASSKRFVIVYSSDFEQEPLRKSPHVRHRNFTNWVDLHASAWELKMKVPNSFPFDGDYTRTSFCDFFIFEKRTNDGREKL